MNLDDLSWIGHIKPSTVRFPPFRDDLNKRFTKIGVGDVGDTFAICFDA